MNKQEKEQIIKAIRQLGRRVTVADVAAKTGLSLHGVTAQLNSIASETRGDLQVSTSGDIAYCFPIGFQNTYIATGIKRAFQQAGATLFRVGFYLLRVSFGIMLIVSLVTIVVLAFIVLTAMQRGSDSDSGSGFDFDFFDFVILRDILWWGTWAGSPDYYTYNEPSIRQRRDSNFLLDCFSFLFGDGDPNAHLEERRWQLAAQAIKLNGGVVTAEQLAPYTGVDPNSSYGIMPVLVRFDGRPEVTDSGNIVYVFPSMQVSALGQTGRGAQMAASTRAELLALDCEPRRYLYEFPWKFSSVPGGSLTLVGCLAAANFGGAWWLFAELHSPWVVVLHPFTVLIEALVVYGSLFVGLPAVRWLVIQWINRGIVARNSKCSGYAAQLVNPAEPVAVKLQEAQSYKVKEQLIRQDEVVYTTEKDVFEQEFEK